MLKKKKNLKVAVLFCSFIIGISLFQVSLLISDEMYYCDDIPGCYGPDSCQSAIPPVQHGLCKFKCYVGYWEWLICFVEGE